MKNKILIEYENDEYAHKIPEKKISEWIINVISELKHKNSYCSVSFISSKNIQEINKLYLNKDYPTDVLSFSQIEGEKSDFINSCFLGDVVICVEQAQKQAFEKKHPLVNEIKLLLLHGILHLLGYDHEQNDNNLMCNLQKDIYLKLSGEKIE